MSGIHWIKVEGNHMEYGKPVKSHSSPSNKSFPESVLSGQPLCIDVMRPLATAQVAIRAEELRYSLPLNGCIKASCLELNHPMNPIKCVKYMHCSRDSMHLYAFQQLTNRMLFDYINIETLWNHRNHVTSFPAFEWWSCLLGLDHLEIHQHRKPFGSRKKRQTYLLVI